MDCFQFKDKSVEEKIDFATKEKLCKKHFSKARMTKGKNTPCRLYRQDQRQVSINSSISHKKDNLPKITIFPQVLSLKVSNRSQKFT